jgi:hypothetical protein
MKAAEEWGRRTVSAVTAVFGKEGEVCLARGLGRCEALHFTSPRGIFSSSSHLLVPTLLACWSPRFSSASLHLAASHLAASQFAASPLCGILSSRHPLFAQFLSGNPRPLLISWSLQASRLPHLATSYLMASHFPAPPLRSTLN